MNHEDLRRQRSTTTYHVMTMKGDRPVYLAPPAFDGTVRKVSDVTHAEIMTVRQAIRQADIMRHPGKTVEVVRATWPEGEPATSVRVRILSPAQLAHLAKVTI